MGYVQTGAMGVVPAGLQLVLLRHLVRHYVRQGSDRVYAIEIQSQSFAALNAWDTNSVAPLYLA